MFDLIRQRPRAALITLGIPALIALVYLVSAIRLTQRENDGAIGALLDDTWIHVRFAHHLSRGEGLTYNEGDFVSGATSPLWVLTIGAALAVLRPPLIEEINIAIVLSATGHIASVMAISGFGWFLTRRAWVGLVTGMITALSGRWLWMGLSGMEITTFGALCVLALWSHLDDRRAGRGFGWRTGILAALATLARPEGYLLAGLIGLDALIRVVIQTRRQLFTDETDPAPRPPSPLRQVIGSLWRGTIAYIILAGSYPLACLLMTGYPLPTTFRVKSQLGRQWPDLPFAFFWQPLDDFGWPLVILAAIGAIGLLWRDSRPQEPRSGWLIPLWPALFVLAVLFMGPDNYVINNSRYVAPAIPFQTLLAVCGVMLLGDWAARFVRHGQSARQRRIAAAIPAAVIAQCALLIAIAYTRGSHHRPGIANDVGQLRRMHLAAAEWITAATEPDDLIALNDVGAIAHLSGRPILDLEGLVSEETIDAVAGTERYTCERDLALMRLMLRQRPALIGVFAWWYPCMTGWPGIMQPWNEFTITGPTVIGGGQMIFYRPLWDQWPVQAQLPESAIAVGARFDQGIELAAYQIEPVENGLRVMLWWRASDQPTADYTVFAHFYQGDEFVAQRDSPPQDDRFPTRLWRPGDIIPDPRLIDLSDPDAALERDDAALHVGLYLPDAGRLPRADAVEGQPPDAAVIDLGAP
jgi:hypothetical protein